MNNFLFQHVDVGIIGIPAEDEEQALFALSHIVKDSFPQTNLDEWNRYEGGSWWDAFCSNVPRG